MSGKTRRTVTTIETREIWVSSGPGQIRDLLCGACHNQVVMLTPHEAAQRARVSQRTVYRWVEEGRVHFAETADGGLFVCLTPLLI